METSNINMLPDLAGFQSSVTQSLDKLAAIKEHEIKAEEARQKQLVDLITVSTQGMADSDNIEISKALEEFQKEAIATFSKHKGRLPYEEQARLNAKNTDLKMMVAKSAEFRKEYQDLMKAVAMDKSQAYDKELTSQNLTKIMKTPLADRPSLWNAVEVNESPIEFVKKYANKDVSETFVKEGNAIRIKKTNNPAEQVRTFYLDSRWRRQVDNQYEEMYGSLPMEQRLYKTPLDFAIAAYSPTILKEAEQYKKNPTIRLAGGGSSSKTPKLYTLNGSKYSFNTNPIALYGITINGEPDSAQRLFNVVEYDKASGKAWGQMATPKFYTWESVKNMPELYNEVWGSTEAEKKKRYDEMVTNPSALDDNTREFLFGKFVNPASITKSQGQLVELNVTPEIAALIEGRLGGYTATGGSAPKKQATKSKWDKNVIE